MFNRFFVKMNAAGDGSGAAGAEQGQGQGAGQAPPPDLSKENADLKAKLAAFEKDKTDREQGLDEKARIERESKEKQKAEHAALESAVRFTVTGRDFLKENKSLLPENVEDIFGAADKETFDSPVNKASAIKDGLIQEFFKVQENLDLLTQSQKSVLESYLKLTKTGREERAQQIFDQVFEPALEMKKRVKKADEVNRTRNGFGNDSDKAYKQKMIELSRKHYLGGAK